jgi:glycosyltransferase involved in cell wall biosynthesis
MNTRVPYSAVIITRDAAATLPRCLVALRRVPEVVVYDNGSSDPTCDIARSFPNVRLVEGPFIGFGPTKNRAVEAARHDWILSLDADEFMNEALLEAIEDWLATAPPRAVAELLRDNHFLGRPVRVAGLGRDWLVRVFNRRHHRFTDAAVHEKVAIARDTPVTRLRPAFEHRNITSVSQYLRKLDLYSELYAGAHPDKRLPLPLIWLRATWAFLQAYLLQAGFTAGWRGLTLALGRFHVVYFKFIKIRARAEDLGGESKNVASGLGARRARRGD